MSAFDESPRPTKRRRLILDSESGRSQSSDVEEGFDDYDLPTHESATTPDESPGEKRRSKHKIHVPEKDEELEDQFVTQLAQVHSSPSRIRGPRWRKPNEPSPSPEIHPPVLRRPFAQPTVPVTANRSVVLQRATVSPATRATTAQDEFDLQDFEFDDDALAEIDSGHQQTTGLIRTTSEPNPRTTEPVKSLRQTTLFGKDTTSSSPRNKSSSQSRPHAWPLSNKTEPLTHHKLDYAACATWVYPTNLGKTRDYQFNIVQRGLFHNLLVALPTGLGKTFIAATIMLNWWRWTKEAQIIFIAPTKPLVSQQVEACFNIAGIPRSQTTMLTGNVPPALRTEEWQTKRVFFMTPQTLHHDLTSGICDPKRIVLLIVDEAHRATGNYSYVEVVRFLRRFTTSFRVVGLTATPGADVEAVQKVIDGLDIARTEIRTEFSIDIREFVHDRNVEKEIFDYSDEMIMAMDLFGKALQPVVSKLASQNAFWTTNPMKLTPFGLTKARQQWMMSDAGKNANYGLKGMVNSIFNVLASLAHGLELLKFHGIGPFFSKIKAFEDETLHGTGQQKYAKEIALNEHFKKLIGTLKTWVGNSDFVGHPKLAYLNEVVLNHFIDAGEGRGAAGGRPPSETRIMIFVHFRDSAEQVVRSLHRHEPMIRPHIFHGQSSSNNSSGMDQKTQLRVIEDFKKGTYNTLIATSIGEEGLDIGEVDLIVCYDSSASPIRMLQRMGRTGRKRAGTIVLLLMRDKEEENFAKAQDNYEKIQRMIEKGDRFQYHDERSPRIIPREIVPVVDKRVVEIPVENTQSDLPEPKKRGRLPKKAAKKFHMPDGVETGFVMAGALDGDSSRRKSTAYGSRQKKLTVDAKVKIDVDVAPLPELTSIILTPSQERDLDVFRDIGGDEPQYVQQPRFHAFPKLQRTLRKVAIVPHSRLTKAITALQKRTRQERCYEDRPRPDADSQSMLSSPKRSLGGPKVKKLPKASNLSSTEISADEDSDIESLPDFNSDRPRDAVSIAEDAGSDEELPSLSQIVAPASRIASRSTFRTRRQRNIFSDDSDE